MSIQNIVLQFEHLTKQPISDIKSLLGAGISKTKIRVFTKKYEDLITNALYEASDYKSKYDELRSNPLIAYIDDQDKKIAKLEQRIEELEHNKW